MKKFWKVTKPDFDKVKKKRSVFRTAVNILIGAGLVLLVLLLIILGFSQTKTFRELLRENAISIVNSSINGKLNISSIDGTIFTSLILRDVSISEERDTLISAKKIELNINPFQILLKKIYVKKLELENARFVILQDSTGSNLSRIFASKKEPDTTAGGGFPFYIQVANLSLVNASFRKTSYERLPVEQDYPRFESGDINIKYINLSLSAFADINNKDFEASISFLNAKPNIKGFYLRDLSGDFYLDTTRAEVDGFAIKTDNTDLELSAKMENFNLFDGFHLAKLKDKPVAISLDVEKFYFDDLTNFVESTHILKGAPSLALEASGKFGDLNIDELTIELGKTHLELTGNVKDLHTPKNMYIRADIKNGVIDDKDANKLLPTLDLPKFEDVVLNDMHVKFDGHPTKFAAKLNAKIGEGNISADSKFDFDTPVSVFDINVKTENLNLQPVIGTHTRLNSAIAFKGEGFSPRTSTSSLKLSAANSYIGSARIDSIRTNISIADKNVYADIKALSKKFTADIKGKIDFSNEDIPQYDLYGTASKLDLAEILQDTSMSSDLNFDFSVLGEGFSLNNINSAATITIKDSRLKSYDIDSSVIALKAFEGERDSRRIELRSDYVDADIFGKFDFAGVASLIAYQTNAVSKTVEKKIFEFNPLALVNDSIKAEAKKYELENIANEPIPEIASSQLDVYYNIAIKDAGIISAFIDSSGISMEAAIKGRMLNSENVFSASLNVSSDYIRYVTNSDLLYASNLKLNINFEHNNKKISFDDFKGKINLSVGRLFNGSFIQNALVDISLANNKSNFRISAGLDSNLAAELKGDLDMSGREYKFAVDSLLFSYNKIKWVNSGKLEAVYSKDYFNLKNFDLRNDTSHIIGKGYIYGDGKEELTLDISKVPGSVITGLLMNNTAAGLQADFNLKARINGYLHAPRIDMEAEINGIAFGNKKFGFIRADFNYNNKSLDGNLVFLDSLSESIIPSIDIVAQIPIDLSFVGAKERLSSTKPFIISLNAERFNLGSLGNMLPEVNLLGGDLTADLNISGMLDNLNYTGNLNITNGSFIADANNLKYGFNADLLLSRQTLNIQKFTLENLDGLRRKGKMNGSGNISFDGFDISSIDIKANGDLAVLDNKSKSASPNAYGDLFIVSDGDLVYRSRYGNSSFTGNVAIKRNEKLVFPQTQGGGSGENEDFVYRYKIDSTMIPKDQLLIEEAKKIARERWRNARERMKRENSNFSYAVRVKIEDELNIEFVLSKEFDQRLKVVLGGEIFLENKNGLSNAQGEFALQEGSTLTFFKTLDAAGTIRFENDLANPRLNITATYRDMYRDSIDVAVKIKLQGLLSDLGQELKNNPENIAVYMGTANIDNNTADPTKTTTDALMFILSGNFQENATAAQQNMLASAATSLAGSVLGGFASKYLGDYIRSVDVRTGTRGTQVSISGRYENFVWTVGSTVDNGQSSQANQDLAGGATFKVEYLFTKKFIMRLERKDPSTSVYDNAEKINELGIKYRFEF